MQKDKYKTEVIFRRVEKSEDFKGTVFALLPYEINDNYGNVVMYQCIGQHSGADYNHSIKTSKLANKKEYSELKKEMESVGYNFKVIKKRNYNKYLKVYKKVFA